MNVFFAIITLSQEKQTQGVDFDTTYLLSNCNCKFGRGNSDKDCITVFFLFFVFTKNSLHDTVGHWSLITYAGNQENNKIQNSLIYIITKSGQC